MPVKRKLATTVKEAQAVHRGNEIILPVISGKKMSYDEAIEWLRRMKKDEETPVDVFHKIQCAPLDGAVAFHRALKKIYGWTQQVTIPPAGFFDPPKPPVVIGVDLGGGETMQVTLGGIMIPGVEGRLEASITARDGNPCFILGGEVLKRHEKEIKVLMEETKRQLKENSIYKGRAIRVSWGWLDRGDKYDSILHAPQFMELSGVAETDLIFGEKVLNDLKIGLFTPIEHSQACREAGVPLKRGVLLYGPYGTGKTMTAHVAALKAAKNGWTFIYLDDADNLQRALRLAADYAPAVVFAEDIDRIMSGERSLDMDDILNTLDGVDTKGAEIITVFTTNHLEDINPATLRMGRLDTLVHVTPPDAKAAAKLVELYGRGLLEEDTDLEVVGVHLEGKIPAFIREATERGKIAAIARLGDGDIKGKVLGSDIISAAQAMERHADLLEPRKKTFDVNQYHVLVPGHRVSALENGKEKEPVASEA